MEMPIVIRGVVCFRVKTLESSKAKMRTRVLSFLVLHRIGPWNNLFYFLVYLMTKNLRNILHASRKVISLIILDFWNPKFPKCEHWESIYYQKFISKHIFLG